MIEKVIFWWGVVTGCIALLWVGAVVLDNALDRVLRTTGSYKLMVEFLWDKQRKKREATRRHGSGPLS